MNYSIKTLMYVRIRSKLFSMSYVGEDKKIFFSVYSGVQAQHQTLISPKKNYYFVTKSKLGLLSVKEEKNLAKITRIPSRQKIKISTSDYPIFHGFYIIYLSETEYIILF